MLMNSFTNMFVKVTGLCCSGIVIGCFLLVSCSSEPDAQQVHQEIVPAEWTPSLEQVQADLEESSTAQANRSQRALNRSIQNLADLSDAQLFITYVLLMQKLDSKQQHELFNEQSRWLSQREETARAAVVSKGGSLEPFEYASAVRSTTEKRLAELQARLKQQSTPQAKPSNKKGE